MSLNFNVGPYYDDYAESNKFYRILYRPGVAVQARELTQMQTILQNQISKLGAHLFEEGAMVIPGHITYDGQYSYIKLKDLNSSSVQVEDFREDLVGKTVSAAGTGLSAIVLRAEARTLTDPITLYVKYTTSGTDNVTKVFERNEELTFSGIEGYTATVEDSATATGYGAAVSIGTGVYFVSGHFCLVEAQTLIVSKYDQQPNCKVGFTVNEEFVTQQNISTLFPDITTRPSITDNAAGTPNYTAPGAHRYYIDLELSSKDLTDTALTNFVQLMELNYGAVTKFSPNTNYALLEDTLARRTYDESGNYVVKTFKINVREHLNNGTNRGVYTAAQGGLESKLAVGLDPGKAYVRGYEIESLTTNFVPIDKARETQQVNNIAQPFQLGNYVLVDNIYNIPDISSFQLVSLRSVVTSTAGKGTAVGVELGTARVRVFEHHSGTDGEVVAGLGTAKYKVFLFDIQMSGTNQFSAVRSIYGAGTPPFTADIVTDAFVDIVTGTTTYQAVLKNSQYNTLLVPLPYNTVKTIRTALGTIDTNYYVRRIYKGTLASGETTITAGVNEQFITPYSKVDYQLAIQSTGEFIDLSDPHTDGNSRVVLSGTPFGKNVTFRIDDLGFTTESFTVMATVYKAEAQEKSKTLTTATYTINSPNLTAGNADVLNKADVYEITNVYMSTDFATPATTSDQNITTRYELDTGMRDNFYALGRLILKPGASAPTGRLLIQFKFFSHGAGDYFSSDSYTGQIAYDLIPSYTSKDTTYQLRDCLDFRPRVRDDGTSYINDAGLPNGSGGSLTEIVKVGDAVRADLQYYLSRVDKIYLDFKGNFGVVKGVASNNPQPPRDPDDAMVLYSVKLNPYTFGPSDVIPTIVDNKRYTMRDIGKIESRLKNLEYYTSLSLLEKETADLQILDPVTNIDRFKNGFIVDPFYGHNIGDSGNADYHVSIDANNGEARPQYYSDSVRLEFDSGSSSGIQKTGDLITLPYTHTSFISQQFASETINVNPFQVFTWFGNLTLSPSGDEWKDTDTRPELIVDNQALFTIVENLVDPSGVLGTVWNEWQTQWTGTQVWNSQSGNRIDTIETIQSAQARAGIRTDVAPDTIQTSLGDRVVDIRMIPFIRSRRVRFVATSMKPNTRVWPFFDGINVSDFCKPRGFTSFVDDAVDVERIPDAVRHPDLTATDITNETNRLISDANGTVEGEFYIPNTELIRFRTGQRTLRLCDSETADANEITTSAERLYYAEGLLETRQEVSLREPHFIRTDVTDTRTVTTNRVIGQRWIDPLAQTFLIDQPGGAFITKIDLFFRTKSSTAPVTVQIRTVENGYPSEVIVPFGESSKLSANVNVSATGVTATTFTFPSPVYLRQNAEYAFVVLSDSQDYTIWTSTLGAFDVNTGNRISQQPYLGSLFTSQNSSTWTANQLSDLKFTMYRASFSTTSAGALFNNASITPRRLADAPIYTTSGSTTVKIYHPNHGMTDSSYVIISGVLAAGVNGVPQLDLNGQHQIYDVEQDWYKFNVGTAATSTGNAGGQAIFATENKMMNVIQPVVSQIVLPDTKLTYAMRITTGKSLAGSESSYTKDASNASREIIVGENYYTTRPYMIASQVNENEKMSGEKSFDLVATFSTTVENLSPVIDLERCAVYTITNRIDNSQARGGTDTSKNQVDNYISELSPNGGSALCKYITKKITLNSSAKSLQVLFGANRPDGSTIEVYYRAAVSGSDTRLEDKAWEFMDIDSPVPTSANENEFRDYTYTVDGISDYTVFSIKVVMKSINSSAVPRIRDFRAIALGT